MLPPPQYTKSHGLPPEISNRVKDRISIYYPSLGRVDQQIQHPLSVQLVAQKKGAATRVYHAFKSMFSPFKSVCFIYSLQYVFKWFSINAPTHTHTQTFCQTMFPIISWRECQITNLLRFTMFQVITGDSWPLSTNHPGFFVIKFKASKFQCQGKGLKMFCFCFFFWGEIAKRSLVTSWYIRADVLCWFVGSSFTTLGCKFQIQGFEHPRIKFSIQRIGTFIYIE